MNMKNHFRFEKIPHGSTFFRLALTVFFATGLSLIVNAQSGNSQKRELALDAPIKNLPAKTKRWALVIGIDRYEDSQIAQLSGAANDAKFLADALIRYAGFPEDQVILITSDSSTNRPTRGNILRRLSNLRGVVPKDGLLFIAFAGHGIERGGHAYLLPTDSQVSDDLRLLEDTAVNVTRIRDTIKEAGIQQVVFIVDACRNEPTSGRADAENPLTASYINGFNFDVRNKEVTAFATLFATSKGKISFESKDKRQGYFTAALIEGLKGNAANSRGEVTLASLVDYLEVTVKKRVQAEIGKVQQPFAIVEGYKANELVLAIKGQVAERKETAQFDAALPNTAKPSVNQVEEKPKPIKFTDGVVTFELLSCRRAKGAVKCNLLFTNDTEKNIYIRFPFKLEQNGERSNPMMTDDSGIIYLSTGVQLGGVRQRGDYSIEVARDVPIGMEVSFNELSAEVNQIKFLNIRYSILFSRPIVETYPPKKDAQFRNIPLR
jgi:uncharacterized caspase-like protein